MLHLKPLFFVFIFIQLALSSNSFADKEIRASVINWPPYQIYQGESEISGIVNDVFSEVQKRLGIDFTLIKLPQKRMLSYFRNGELDIESISSPAWRTKDKNISLYTIPYLKIQEVIAVNKSAKLGDNYVHDFKGKTIGTILGYNYDNTLGKAFDEKVITRKDSIRHDRNLLLLKAGRIDGVIVERQVNKYWINQLKHDPDEYKEAYDIGPSMDLSMRLHISQSDLLPKLNQTLSELINEGYIDKLIEKYTKQIVTQEILNNPSKKDVNELVLVLLDINPFLL